jgi:hypothetical protein
MSSSKSSKQKFHDALDDLLDRPIAYNPAFRKITGRTSAAVWLSQQWYWAKRTRDPEGWVYKSARECTEETGLTDNEQQTARQICKKLGVIDERLRGVPATLHYRINKSRIRELLGLQFPDEQETEIPIERETEIPAQPKTSFPADREIPGEQESDPAGNFNKESENTSKIQTENTNQEVSLSKIWEQVLDQLKPQTPRASFDAHIQPTQPIRYGRNTLYVLAPNPESCQWLEERVQRSAERLLVGIMNEEVTVSFLVTEETR